MEELKKKLGLANLEIARLKNVARKFAVKEAYFNQMQARWEDKTFQIPEVVDCNVQFLSWTIPSIKEAQFIRKFNTNLRSGIKLTKKKIEDLKIQLSSRSHLLYYQRNRVFT